LTETKKPKKNEKNRLMGGVAVRKEKINWGGGGGKKNYFKNMGKAREN